MSYEQNTPTMKTPTSNFIRTSLVIASLFTMGYAHAGGDDRPTKNSNSINSTTPAKATKISKELDRELSKHLVYPLLEREHNMNGVVFVSFVVNKEGKLEILECLSGNPHLQAYVMKKLERVDLPDNEPGFWKTTRMQFVFRPQG